MLKFRQFIVEGGNLKVDGASASHIEVTAKNRPQHQKDTHEALAALHTHVHNETGEHLYGHGMDRLHNHSVYTGSSHSMMDPSISHKEFAKHKPKVGDIDTQVHEKHKPHLEKALVKGKQYGKFTVAGTKKHGKEISAVMKHSETGKHHQFDFQYTDHPGSAGNRFLHSSHWNDTKRGVKGLHHKIMLNAAGGDKHKFSITHGIRSRTDDKDPGSKDPKQVSKKLFGKDVGSDIHSFHGVVHSIKKHIPADQHQAIADKFTDSLKRIGHTDHTAAIAHVHKTLGTKPSTIKEEADGSDHHVHVAFLGASPFPHQGHGKDIGGSMDSAPKGHKFVGLSGKSNAFSDDERAKIAHKVFGKDHHVKVEKFAGVTVGRAMDHVRNKPGKKHLHLHFGHDRAAMAERLKKSVEDGKIPELGKDRFHSVHVHLPKDTDRSHGMSGTKMRQAAHDGDVEEFHRHIGKGFSRGEAHKLMKKTAGAIKSGDLKLKR